MLVAMSSTIGNGPSVGAAIEIGLVDSRAAVPPNGATACPAPPEFTVAMPTSPAAAAISV